ncbi:hypothetical protein BJ684DRAFT_18900 [Piptocephalis cylindrospora]|uniref:Uncharacterized protein n=1 Tax=Piptocephalis cylindrospora TaxID=1907219 RepID=A0A4P9Y6K9_9FUNG|nr:hypothetical protein BJ684DRAFT_18900 [Piptocephalis cylindrospora]|eukprot:RKP14718.1 hypothetical protein BJ684DRAFT_18900 [Piptocephalis cylindrospora]
MSYNQGYNELGCCLILPTYLDMSNKTLWQSYTSMTPRFRLTLGLVGFTTGLIGLYVSDKLEQLWPAPEDDIQLPAVHVQSRPRGSE